MITCSINQFHTDYDAWDALAQDVNAYRQEKAQIGDEVINAIETRLSRMKGRLKALNVVTPKTF